MTETAAPILGGCQCGAVRYSVSEATRSSVCHCRMCQRAVGNVFAALVMAPKAAVSWTRGEPAWFASSNVAKRGFCRACGTPLAFAYDDRDRMEVTTGSLDDPAAFPISEHAGVESRVAWVRLNPGLPEHRTDEGEDSPVHEPGFRSAQGQA